MSTDRDRILEQALKHELRAVGTPPAGACLDAETLGAWTDGTLDATAMASIEAHVSNCARCQSLVGAMTRSTPSTSSTLGTQGTPGTIGTLSLWKWWLAPIAAGVTAVTLWMVVPEQPQLATAEATLARAPAAETISPSAATRDKDAVIERSVDLRANNDKLAATTPGDRPQEKQSEGRKEEAPARLQEPTTLADAAAAPPAAPTAGFASPAARQDTAMLQKNAAVPPTIEIATLNPSIGWRIAGDRIEHSGDGGKTWTVVRQNAADGLTAGSAPADLVCWFVGRGGRVLLTGDGGSRFFDVSLAEPLDLASVAAIDARTAMVYAVSGRRFRTADGGRTWQPF